MFFKGGGGGGAEGRGSGEDPGEDRYCGRMRSGD